VSASPQSVPARPATRIKRRVLVIDDNQDAAYALEQLVRVLGGESATASSGAMGLQRAREFQPDVVLLDIHMPGMDGYKTCRRLRREFADRQPVIVALTGWGQDHHKRLALESGFDAHLTKPADRYALEAVLRVLNPLAHEYQQRYARFGGWPSSDFKQVFAHDHRATEVNASRLGPHLFCDVWIIGRYQVREHQGLDAGGLRHAASVFR